MSSKKRFVSFRKRMTSNASFLPGRSSCFVSFLAIAPLRVSSMNENLPQNEFGLFPDVLFTCWDRSVIVANKSFCNFNHFSPLQLLPTLQLRGIGNEKCWYWKLILGRNNILWNFSNQANFDLFLVFVLYNKTTLLLRRISGKANGLDSLSPAIQSRVTWDRTWVSTWMNHFWKKSGGTNRILDCCLQFLIYFLTFLSRTYMLWCFS